MDAIEGKRVHRHRRLRNPVRVAENRMLTQGCSRTRTLGFAHVIPSGLGRVSEGIEISRGRQARARTIPRLQRFDPNMAREEVTFADEVEETYRVWTHAALAAGGTVSNHARHGFRLFL